MSKELISIEDVDNVILPSSMVCVVRYCFDWSKSTTFFAAEEVTSIPSFINCEICRKVGKSCEYSIRGASSGRKIVKSYGVGF